ncbi:hypothetical protein BH10BAC5_BH10BAC5_09280 [soil metagenome]
MKNLILFFFILVITSPLLSQWSTNPAVNNLVSNIPGDQIFVTSCPDGAGGIIMTWEDNSSGSIKIFAQKINSFGQAMWTVGGISICPLSFDQRFPDICTDAAGGAIIYWKDFRAGVPFHFDMYAQRIRTDGMPMWNINGVKVNNLISSETYMQNKCIPSDAGSSVILWANGVGADYGLYTQKLDAFGNKLWDVNDILISALWKSNFDLCTDGGGGAYFCWSDPDPADLPYWNLYAQHIDASGIVQWSPKKTVSAERELQKDPSMCEDQNGGFIVTWLDRRSFYYTPLTPNLDIYAAHFTSGGINLWQVNGTPICNDLSDQVDALCISDLHSGAHIFWSDRRNLPVSFYSIYGQNISYNGTINWTPNGNLIASREDYYITAGGRYVPQIASIDALGGIIVCWLGYYDAALTQYGLLVQKVDYYGSIQWDPNGVFASIGHLKQRPSLIHDGGSGGCNIAWVDARSGNYDIYAQHIKSNSLLGNKPKPVSGIVDILSQNYPNPFNPTTNIAFTLANDANISISIFDMSGRQLEVLADGFLTAGEHSVTWNASNYASGTYFYKFTNGNHVEIKKMLLVK